MGITLELNSRAFLLLSIMVPISLLAALKITGFTRGPLSIAETTTLEPSMWIIERQDAFNQLPNASKELLYDGEELSLRCLLQLTYDPHWFTVEYVPATFVGITNFTCDVNRGFIYGIIINFSEQYPNSEMVCWSWQGFYTNLTNGTIVDCQLPNHGNTTSLSITTFGVNNPTHVSIERTAFLWRLLSPYNYTHRMEINAEITYFNGSFYKNLVVPVHCTIGPDDNNSFETADEIGYGAIQGFIGGGPFERTDFYKIWLQEGESLTVTLSPPFDQDLNLFLYGPDLTQRANSTNYQDAPDSVSFTADCTGYWYIEVVKFSGDASQTYTLNVTSDLFP